MAVETWDKPVTEIDNTYGYNDMLFVLQDFGNGKKALSIDDRLQNGAAISGQTNPSSGLTGAEADIQKALQPNDRLFRLPNGGILLRRSVFTETCQGPSLPENSLPLSEPMSRALAFFGARHQGSDPSGDHWCRRAVPGTTGDVETPWNLSSMDSLKKIEAVLSRIGDARKGNLPSDLQPAQHQLAKELADAIPAAELKTLASEIKDRRERLESAGDLFMRHPVLHTIGIAILFGLGTDVYHIARYALFGGEAPWKGEGRGLFTRLYQGLRKLFGKDPKDPPEGGSGGGPKELPRIAVNEMPAGAQVSGGYVVVNGQTVGIAVMKKEITSENVPEGQVVSGEINAHGDDLTVLTPVPDFGIDWENEPTRVWEALPDGVVPLDQGAFIYRYQATINGEIVGLSETVARQLATSRGLAFDANSFFSAGDFQYGEFMKLASPAPVEPSPQDVVRSMGLKAPPAIAPRSVARLASKKEAADSAAEKMTTGTGPSVTGFGAPGVSVGAPAPAVRGVPLLVVP